MSRLANDVRFTQTWYNNPPYPVTLADVQALWPQFAQRAAWLHTQYPTGRIGVAGVGLAWTQYFLFQNHSRQSWGFDIDWATTKAKINLGAYSSFVTTLDIVTASAAQLTAYRRMGNTGQAKYDIIFTEDLLPCANSDAEVQTMLTNLRTVGTSLVHLVTVSDSTSGQTSDMLWHTPAEWRGLVGADRLVLPSLLDIDQTGKVVE